MKSFIVAIAVALVGSSMFADDASARAKRGAGMAGMAAMAPVALSAGAALIGSAGYVDGLVVTPYVSPVTTYVDPVVTPTVHVPVYTPVHVPTPGLPGSTWENVGG